MNKIEGNVQLRKSGLGSPRLLEIPELPPVVLDLCLFAEPEFLAPDCDEFRSKSRNPVIVTT